MKKYCLMIAILFAYVTMYGQCPQPSSLSVTDITDTSVKLQWNLSSDFVSDFQVRYLMIGSSAWKDEWQFAPANSSVIRSLSPHTTYRWEIRSLCTKDKSVWVAGPNFTTEINGNPEASVSSVQIIPNPSNGNFNIQMKLPGKTTSTFLALYNSTGKKVWQYHAGKIGGPISKDVYLENRLLQGTYLLVIHRSDIRLEEKIIINR